MEAIGLDKFVTGPSAYIGLKSNQNQCRNYGTEGYSQCQGCIFNCLRMSEAIDAMNYKQYRRAAHKGRLGKRGQRLSLIVTKTVIDIRSLHRITQYKQIKH